MASRKKEDEKNEKIIRGLLKLPANRRCINCNNLGPQYVCTNFWTFICTNCSGLHREFCHRVKSISMAKFTAQEVSALQEGGNERAREIYFKDWDSQRNSLPDSSNIDRLRDFIKHVYVDRRFSGEKNTDKPLRGKADMSDSSDSGRGDSYRGSPRSPAYDDRFNERLGVGGRNGDRNFRNVYGERSPGYDQGDNKRSPRRFEVVDDRVRDDRSGNGNQFHRFEDRRLPEVLTKPDESSPSSQKDMASPPLVRPVRDILGSDAPQLHAGDTSKSNNSSIPDNSSQTQRASSSSSVGSGDGNTLQSKKVDFGSLIDFSEVPEPPAIASPQQSVRQQNISPPSNGGDWASFDVAAHQTASQAAASSGVVNSGLTQLSALLIPSVDASPKAKDGGEWPKAQQHQASLFPADLSSSTNPPLNAPVTGSRQWGLSGVPGIQGPLPNSAGNLPQVPNKPPPEPTPPGSTPPHVEVKPTGRKELPVDLFAALYPPAHVSMPGWQRGPHPGMAYGMQYPVGMHQSVPTFPHPSRSSNPFDFGSEPALTHAPTFPSLGSLQGALPNVPGPSPLLRSTSFGNPSSQWGLGHQSSFPPALSQGQYLMQQVPGNMQQLPHSNMVMMGHQGTGGPGSLGAMYGNMGMDNTHSTGRYSLPNTPNSNGSGGGNPFG